MAIRDLIHLAYRPLLAAPGLAEVVERIVTCGSPRAANGLDVDPHVIAWRLADRRATPGPR